MREQAPGGLGGESSEVSDADFESVVGLSRDELEQVLSEKHFYNFWLGNFASDRPTTETDRVKAANRIDECLRIFGLSGQVIIEAYAGVRGIVDHHNPIRKDELQAAVDTNESIGELFCRRAWLSLDIENEEWGYVGLDPMRFNLPGQKMLTISTNGDFWTDREYRHPITKQILDIDDDDVPDLEEHIGMELELVDAEVNYVLEFGATVDQIRQAHE